MALIKRVISFIFYIIVMYVSVKHLSQDESKSIMLPLLMGLISLLGILNTLNPKMLGNFTNTTAKLPNSLLVVVSLGLLFMTGDLSKLIGLAENKVGSGTSVIVDKEKEQLEKEVKKTKENAKKSTETKTTDETKTTKTDETSEVKALEDMTPEELAERKEKLNEGLAISLDNLEKDAAASNHYYYSSSLENKTKKNQVFPYLITTNKENVSDIHMNLWIRYSYVGDEQLDLKKFKIVTDNEEYLMDAYDVNIDRDLQQDHLEPEDLYDDELTDTTEETADKSTGKVWEWIEFSPNVTRLGMLRDMASSKKVAIHYEGKSGSTNRELTKDEVKALREVLQAYDIFLEASK